MDSAAITDSLDAPRMPWGRWDPRSASVRPVVYAPACSDPMMPTPSVPPSSRIVSLTALPIPSSPTGTAVISASVAGPWTRAMPAAITAMTTANGSVAIAVSSAEHPRSAWNHWVVRKMKPNGHRKAAQMANVPMTAHTQNTLSHANRCSRMPPMTGPSAMPTPDVPTRSPTASPRIGDPSNNPMMDDSVAPIKLCINITYL